MIFSTSVACTLVLLFCFFFFKQKTAYEMRISDWSSDVCSSDLPRPFEDAFQHALRAAHLPQHVDVDRALAPGDVPGALHLLHPAVDGIGDQFLMSPAAAQLAVDLGDDLAGRVIAVGVDGRNRADSASRRPCARRGVIAHRNALATLYQWQQFPAGIADRIHPLEHSVDRKSTRLNSSH